MQAWRCELDPFPKTDIEHRENEARVQYKHMAVRHWAVQTPLLDIPSKKNISCHKPSGNVKKKKTQMVFSSERIAFLIINVQYFTIYKVFQRDRKRAKLANENHPITLENRLKYFGKNSKRKTSKGKKRINRRWNILMFIKKRFSTSLIFAAHQTNLKIQGAQTLTIMAVNGTEFPHDSSHPACSFLGDYSWREEYPTPTNFILIIVAVSAESVMIPFTVLFNTLVIFLVWRKRYLRKQKPCVLLACLAATDLMVGAVVLPLVVTAHAFRLSSIPVCLMDTVASVSVYVCCGASLWQLVIISGERYIAIKHALRYETLATTRRLTAAVGAAWAASALSALINVVVTNNDSIFYAITFLAIPGSLAAICFCQVAVFLETRRHRRHILAHQVSETTAKEMLKKDKAARTTALVVGAVLLSYAPVIMLDLATLAARFPMDAKLGALFIYDIFLLGNSISSPIIYCMRTREFKRAVRELLGLEASQVNTQTAANPSTIARRRISEAPRRFSGGKEQIALSELAPVRRFRSQSLNLERDLRSERRNCRKNSVQERSRIFRDRASAYRMLYD